MKTSFAVAVDATGNKFVFQEDEYDRNHNDNSFDTAGERTIYAVEGHPLYPVQTFEMYISKLSPSPWQKPKENVKEKGEFWYSKAGKEDLVSMKTRTSQKYELSQRYTNHCIRIISVQVMDSAFFFKVDK